MGILQARILEWVAMPPSRRPSQPGIEPRSSAFQEDSLQSEPPGKPRYSLYSTSSLHSSSVLGSLFQGWEGPDSVYLQIHTGECVLNHFSRVQLFVTPWTIACQAPLSMWFSRQDYWSELPCLSTGCLPNAGTKPTFLKSPALAGRFCTISATWKEHRRSGAWPKPVHFCPHQTAWWVMHGFTECLRACGGRGNPALTERGSVPSASLQCFSSPFISRYLQWLFSAGTEVSQTFALYQLLGTIKISQ